MPNSDSYAKCMAFGYSTFDKTPKFQLSMSAGDEHHCSGTSEHSCRSAQTTAPLIPHIFPKKRQK
ncbi:unnamed protein product [Oppiella nova]|uniref:Uncharacterized protein n=1 Tax=Oppiella nova TaxID=334625 RepID=A0A7R9MTY8_9ACAR|nr:unnamed protein product [Oppiella nova]CAG2182867.1 unnamed protein product [Oppiella nova]